MKTNTIKNTFLTSLIAVLLFSFNGFAQDDELGVDNFRLLFNFKTLKQTDNSRLLEANFRGMNKKDRKDIVPIYEAEINFYNVLEEEEIALGSAKTGKDGTAKLVVAEGFNYLKDEDGYIHLVAKFAGTDEMDEQEEEILVKDLFFEMNLVEIDSVKTLQLTAIEINGLGEEIPVEELDVKISIGGLLSKLPIGEETIYDGELEFEFPTDIPGDVDGNLQVYVQIEEDHEEFGNIIKTEQINWGTFDKLAVEQKNTLWSEAAPLWMYIVLTVLLVGVWANYVYTVYNLFQIKKEGKKLEA